MTPDRFHECLDILGWSQRGFAEMIRRDPRQIRRWAAGQYSIPDDVGAWLERRATAMQADPPPLPVKTQVA